MKRISTSFSRLEGQRWVSLVIDCSEAMKDTDLPPNRLIRLVSLLPSFIFQFFELNVLSQLQIIAASDGLATVVSPMSGASFLSHLLLPLVSFGAFVGLPTLQLHVLSVLLERSYFAAKYRGKDVCKFGERLRHTTGVLRPSVGLVI